MESTQTSTKSPKLKLDFKDSKYATGRRKTSIAKVWVKKGTGKIYVNGKTMDDYFSSENHKMQIVRPFEIINQSTSYDVRWPHRAPHRPPLGLPAQQPGLALR